MRRVSPTLFAVAGFAALIAAPFVEVSAQTLPTATATISSEQYNCPPPSPVPAASFTSPATAVCASGPRSVTDPVGIYQSTASATATPGVSVVAHADFFGDPGAVPAHAGANAFYYQYLIFDPTNVTEIDLTSIVTPVTQDDPDAAETFKASLDWGFVNTDNTFGAVQDGVNYTNSSTGGLMTLVIYNGGVNDQLFGATEIYFRLTADAEIQTAATDPDVSAEVTASNPTPTFQFDVTGTPEPASLVLMGTGLVGVAGVARRKRRAAV